MRVLKCIVIFALPIVLFINLWRLATMGPDNTYTGIKWTVNYVSTYRGFENTINLFESIYNIFTGDKSFAEVILAITSPLWAPIAVAIAILADIIYHIGFFFGWISGNVFTTTGSSGELGKSIAGIYSINRLGPIPF